MLFVDLVGRHSSVKTTYKTFAVHSVFTQFINQLNETIFWEMLQCVMRYYVHSDKGEKDEVRVVRCKKL